VIGLTVMALGTSLPELAATVVAAIRKQSDMALGNIVGSNIFNIVGIVGVISIITPLDIPSRVLNIDGWVMLGATLLLMPYIIGRWTRLSRFEAFLFLLAYLIYIFSVTHGADTLIP
jgi:cation:H+ antiporter